MPANQINQLFLAGHDISRHKRIRMEIDIDASTNQNNQLFLAAHDISRPTRIRMENWPTPANQINQLFLAAHDISRHERSRMQNWPSPANQINKLFLAVHDISRHKRIRIDILRHQPMRKINYFLQTTTYHAAKEFGWILTDTSQSE